MSLKYTLHDDGDPEVGPGDIPVPCLRDWPPLIGANKVTFNGKRAHIFIIYTPDGPKIQVLAGKVAHADNVLRVSVAGYCRSFRKLSQLIAENLKPTARESIKFAIEHKKFLTCCIPKTKIDVIDRLDTPVGMYENPLAVQFLFGRATLPPVPQYFNWWCEDGAVTFCIEKTKVNLYYDALVIYTAPIVLCLKDRLVYRSAQHPLSDISLILRNFPQVRTLEMITLALINISARQIFLPLPIPIRDEIMHHMPLVKYNMKKTANKEYVLLV